MNRKRIQIQTIESIQKEGNRINNDFKNDEKGKMISPNCQAKRREKKRERERKDFRCTIHHYFSRKANAILEVEIIIVLNSQTKESTCSNNPATHPKGTTDHHGIGGRQGHHHHRWRCHRRPPPDPDQKDHW